MQVEDHAKVYLVIEDGRWTVDPVSDDGYPLDGLEDGAQCIATAPDEADHGRRCDHVDDLPDLPTARELYDLLGELFARRDT